jgi:hypothetical protein
VIEKVFALLRSFVIDLDLRRTPVGSSATLLHSICLDSE